MVSSSSGFLPLHSNCLPPNLHPCPIDTCPFKFISRKRYQPVFSYSKLPHKVITHLLKYNHHSIPIYHPTHSESSSSMVSQNSSSAGDWDITVDVLAAKDLVISSGYRFIDVRTTEEFEKGHPDVENAVNIPYMFVKPEGGRVKNPEFLEQVSLLFRKEDQIVLGCQSGVRSYYATKDLLGAGFKDVKNMGGGYLAWVENAFAVRKPETKAEAKASDEL